MQRLTISLFFLVIAAVTYAQTDQREAALIKAREAIKLMDDGQYAASIAILEECKKMDPGRHIYSYEIGLAYLFAKDYAASIKELKQTLKYPDINSQVYQTLGNAYSYSGKPKKALKTYDQGLRRFSDAGNLYLEKGNVHLHARDFSLAVENYEKGIAVDPSYPSNYFRLAKLFLATENKVPGLIYGELFMNLERTTERTQEMSELLYDTYADAITFAGDSVRTNFCQIVLYLQDIKSLESGVLKLPYYAVYGKNMSLAIIGQTEMSLAALDDIRKNFIAAYYKDEVTDNYPVVLFDYHREMIAAGVFEAYNHYLFQMAQPEAFEAWSEANEYDYQSFIEWYTAEENIIELNRENRYLRYK